MVSGKSKKSDFETEEQYLIRLQKEREQELLRHEKEMRKKEWEKEGTLDKGALDKDLDKDLDKSLAEEHDFGDQRHIRHHH